jgi:MFS transporter, ACS family, hexuronate transporter
LSPPEKPSSAAATLPLPYAQKAMPQRPVHSRFRWVILGLLFLATTINYLHRLVMSILGPDLQVQYHISDVSYGQIQAAFTFAYALGQIAAGSWIDWIGTRIGYAVTLTAWSLASMFHAVMRTAMGFGFARALLGVAESPNYPAAVKTIAEWFPRRERAFAMGFVNAGCNVGAVVAPLTVPWLALHWGWQWAFVATGVVGLLWVFLWLPIYRRPAEHPSVSAEELALINSDPPEPTTKVPWRTLLLYRQTWAFGIGKFFSDPIWWFYMTWVPNFLYKRHGMDLKTIGLPLVIVYLMADVGSIAGGWLSSSLIRRGWSVTAARKTAMLICVLCVLPVMAASHVTHLWAAVALLGLGTAAHQGWSSNLYTIVSDVFPKRTVGSVAGLGGTFGYLGATIFSALTGYLLLWTHQSYTVLFVIASMAYLFGLAGVHFCAPSLEPLVIAEPPGFPVVL